MTITVTTLTAGPFTPTGLAQSLPFDFKVFDKSEIEVIQRTVAGVETTVDPADYTVDINTDVVGSAVEGGSVELSVGAATVVAGSIYVRSIPAFEQEQVWDDDTSSLRNLNEALDRNVLRDIHLRDRIKRVEDVVDDALAEVTEAALLIVTAEGETQVGLVEDAGEAAVATVAASGTENVNLVTAEGGEQVAAVAAEGSEQVDAVAVAGAAALADIDDAGAALFYDDTTAGIAGTVDGEFFKTFAEDRILTYKNVAEVAVLKSIAPKKADVDTVLGRMSPFVNSPIGLELQRVHEISITSPDGDALYAGDYFVRYFSRIGNTLYCSIAFTADSTVLTATGLNGSTSDCTGLTGVQSVPLLQNVGNGVTGFITIDFGAGEGFNPGPAEWSTAQSRLDNDRIIFANPARSEAIAAVALEVARPALDALSPFVSTLADDFLAGLVDDAIVDFAVAGRTYVLRRNSDIAAGPLYRLSFDLYDPVREAVVAKWGDEKGYDWSDEIGVGQYESVYLSSMAQGAPRGDVEFTGLGCTLFLRPGGADFTKGQTLYTDPADAGIKPDRVWSPAETQRRILSGEGARNKSATFGPGGDFETLKAAVDSLLRDIGLPKDDIQRGWWPYSDICTPAHQWTLRAMPGHTEVKLPVVPAGVGYARGILCWMGMTIELLDDTEIKGQMTGGVETYVFDYNIGGRILAQPGTLLWVDGPSTHPVHQDAQNGISQPSAASATDPTAGLLFFRITGLVEGGRYRAPTTPWAAGTSDGQHLILRNLILEVSGEGVNANLTSHSSPDNVFPGYYELDSITCVGGGRSFGFITSHTVNARHGINVKNCDADAVSASGGGYVRIGKQPGVTYDATLEP